MAAKQDAIKPHTRDRLNFGGPKNRGIGICTHGVLSKTVILAFWSVLAAPPGGSAFVTVRMKQRNQAIEIPRRYCRDRDSMGNRDQIHTGNWLKTFCRVIRNFFSDSENTGRGSSYCSRSTTNMIRIRNSLEYMEKVLKQFELKAHTIEIQCNAIFCSTSGTVPMVSKLMIGTIVTGPMYLEMTPTSPVNPSIGMIRTATRQLPAIWAEVKVSEYSCRLTICIFSCQSLTSVLASQGNVVWKVWRAGRKANDGPWRIERRIPNVVWRIVAIPDVTKVAEISCTLERNYND